MFCPLLRPLRQHLLEQRGFKILKFPLISIAIEATQLREPYPATNVRAWYERSVSCEFVREGGGSACDCPEGSLKDEEEEKRGDGAGGEAPVIAHRGFGGGGGAFCGRRAGGLSGMSTSSSTVCMSTQEFSSLH